MHTMSALGQPLEQLKKMDLGATSLRIVDVEPVYGKNVHNRPCERAI